MSILLFAYGSNMASDEMEAWCPEHRFLGRARLRGFRVELRRRSMCWGGGAADIVEAPGEEVWGVVYELADAAFAELDRKEGAGFAYRRREVQVEVDGGRLAALAYEVIDKEPEPVPPTPEYAALVMGAAGERGLPAGYVHRLERRLNS